MHKERVNLLDSNILNLDYDFSLVAPLKVIHHIPKIPRTNPSVKLEWSPPFDGDSFDTFETDSKINERPNGQMKSVVSSVYRKLFKKK